METNKNVKKALFLAALMPLLSLGNNYAAEPVNPDSSSDVSFRGGEEGRGAGEHRNIGNRNNRTNVYHGVGGVGGVGGVHPGYNAGVNGVGGAVVVPEQPQVIVPEQQPVYVAPAPTPAP